MFVDFNYDGELASDFDIMPCCIGGTSGEETINAGSDINFNQVPIRHGSKFLTTDTTYDSPIEATFQVCKRNCSTGVNEFSLDEKRKIARWLQRKEPHVLELIDDENNEDLDRYIFEGTFNLSEIRIAGKCIGFELRFISNRPHAISKTITRTIRVTNDNLKNGVYEYPFTDSSDEVGYIYPKRLTIEYLGENNKTFTLINSIENRKTTIENCVNGEVITFTDMLTISTTNINHSKTIQDDFNYCFFRIANSYKNRINRLSISSPCVIKIEYNPVVKGVGL